MCTMLELIIFLSTPALIWLLGHALNLSGDTKATLITDRVLETETATRNVALFGVEANTTVRKMLTRFALAGNLSTALPVDDTSENIGWPKLLTRNDIHVFDSPTEKHSILAHRAIFNQERISTIMSENTDYIGMIMDPLQRFKSLFYHLDVAKCLNLTSNNTIGEFLNNPRLVCFDVDKDVNIKYNLQNLLLQEYGFPVVEFNNISTIDYFIKQLDEQFKLVIVNEYMDESLVLLRRYMQWKKHDIYYLPTPPDPAFDKNSEPIVKNVILHLEWSKGDYRLYDYFNKTLWRKIDEQGPEFWDEVREFKATKEDLVKECSSAWRAGEIKELPINGEDCKVLKESIQELSVRILKQKGVFRDL